MNAREIVLPVIAGRKYAHAEFPCQMAGAGVFGTAFLHPDGWFVTAAHVVHAAAAFETFGLGFLPYPGYAGSWHFAPVTEFKLYPEIDLAILRADASGVLSLQWHTEDLGIFAAVDSLGYPYAYNPQEQLIRPRGFRGSVVSDSTLDEFPARPSGYEVSFAAPRGLSGAPLLHRHDGDVLVAGVIVGNRSTQMLVFRDSERLVENGSETIVEHYESLQLGIAVRVSELQRRIYDNRDSRE